MRAGLFDDEFTYLSPLEKKDIDEVFATEDAETQYLLMTVMMESSLHDVDDSHQYDAIKQWLRYAKIINSSSKIVDHNKLKNLFDESVRERTKIEGENSPLVDCTQGYSLFFLIVNKLILKSSKGIITKEDLTLIVNICNEFPTLIVSEKFGFGMIVTPFLTRANHMLLDGKYTDAAGFAAFYGQFELADFLHDLGSQHLSKPQLRTFQSLANPSAEEADAIRTAERKQVLREMKKEILKDISKRGIERTW